MYYLGPFLCQPYYDEGICYSGSIVSQMEESKGSVAIDSIRVEE